MLSYTPIVLFNPYFANLALAKTHSLNCTLPPDDSHYVGGVKVRSTLSIFWSAVYTVFACTWAVQHLNIPPLEQPTPEPDWRHFWKFRIPASFWTKLKWMLITLIMPEYLLGRALSDRLDAYRFKKSAEVHESWGHKWTITHGYYANMGGFIFSLPPTPNPNPEHSNRNKDENPDSTSEGRYPAGGNDCSAEERGEHSKGSKKKPPLTGPIAINAVQLHYLLEKGVLDTKPPISEIEILDKSKKDTFATISAVVQLIWLVTQLITRKVLNLPSSQLEILALAFAVCTIFTWILYYPKPQNIQFASNIFYLERDCTHCKQGDIEKERREKSGHERDRCEMCRSKQRSKEKSEYYDRESCTKGVESQGDDFLSARYSLLERPLKDDVSPSFFKNALLPESKDPRELEAIIRNDKVNNNSWFHEFNEGKEVHFVLDAEAVGFQIGAIILGVCHCLAWNFQFPTSIERLLWRIASLSITGIMPIYYFLWYLLCSWSNHLQYDHFRIPLAWLSFTSYVVARLYLLVAPFRELFFLPPEAFIATWSASFPHFS
jgi:hypothetical protein